MPTFACKDLGMDCTFKAEAKTESELMKKIADHASKAHGIKQVTPNLAAKIKKAIKA